MVAVVTMLTVKGTLASGDKVRGDKGVGGVSQVMNEEPNCWDEWWK